MKGFSQFFSSQLYSALTTVSVLTCLLFMSSLPSILNAASGQVEIQPSEDKKTQTQQEIDQLNKKIITAQNTLNKLNNLASKSEKALAQAQKQLSENQKKKRQLETAFQTLQQTLAQTDQEIQQAQKSLNQQKKWITKQLQETYKYGQDNALKLILSGQSPTDTTRLLKYHTQIHADRQVRIDKIKRQQNHLNGLKVQQLDSQRTLLKKQKELALVNQQQKSLKKKYEHSLASAKQSKKTTFTSIQDMRARTQMLENLLQDMIVQEEISKANQTSDFSKLKGKLQLPIQGSLKNTYKSPKPDGSGQWRGAWIHPNSKSSTEVKSVANGHVVFADWLLGYGLLTIVDHGHGYFSLYAHTQTLLRQPGDWVTAQTPLALIKPLRPNSVNTDGLYFEIRHNSQALNPGQWLVRSK